MEQSVRPPEWKPARPSLGVLFHNMRSAIARTYKKHPIWFNTIGIAIILALYAERQTIQPLLLTVRIYAGAALAVLIVVGLVCIAVLLLFVGRSRWLKALVSVLAVVGIGGIIVSISAEDYLSHYFRYERLYALTDTPTMPTTAYERVLPLTSVYTIAQERMNETDEPSQPDMVRVNPGYAWTMAIEPAKWWGQLTYSIREMFSIDSTQTSPDLSRRHPINVNFSIGENFYLWRNTERCVRRSFGPLRSLSYEPGNVLYMENDSGKWVEVVSLIRWTGIFFPYPEFGGVQVIEQGNDNPVADVFLGCGHWIKPEDIGKYNYLRGQNLVPYAVSRYMAESIRFQAGLLAPLPFYRQGDLRLADVPENSNPQPFTLYFKFDQEKEGKLYQYFALEPHDTDKQGLSTSLFVPADGIGPIYRYRHFLHQEAPIGPTVVADQVRTSRKNYQWWTSNEEADLSKTLSLPAEVRPYIRDMPDANGNVERRFEWMVTVVTVKQRSKEDPLQFIAGSDPEIAIVDAFHPTVVWVDHLHPDLWPSQIQEALGQQWASDAP